MYKSYKFEAKSLFPHQKDNKFNFQKTAEGLMPFLIIAATFVWLWK